MIASASHPAGGQGGIGSVSNPNQESSRDEIEKVFKEAYGIGTETKTLFKTVCGMGEHVWPSQLFGNEIM